MPQNTPTANTAVIAQPSVPAPEWIYIVYRETWSTLPPSRTQQLQNVIRQRVPGVTHPPDFYFMCAEMMDACLHTVWVGTNQIKAREKLLEVAERSFSAPGKTKATTSVSGALVYLYTEESKNSSELCGKAWVEVHVVDRTRYQGLG